MGEVRYPELVTAVEYEVPRSVGEDRMIVIAIGGDGIASAAAWLGCAAPAGRKGERGAEPNAVGPDLARLLTINRDDLSKADTITVAAIEGGVPMPEEAREIIAAFQAMIRKKTLTDLDSWVERARTSLVGSFANGVAKDKKAVSAAITSPWSNGQTEGQITKLKLVKRQMYGLGKLDLLQARVIGAD